MTVLDVVNKIIDLMKSPLQPKILNMAQNEIQHQYLSAKKAREMLGWTPRHTFDDGLAKTVGWYQKFFSQ